MDSFEFHCIISPASHDKLVILRHDRLNVTRRELEMDKGLRSYRNTVNI